MTQTRKYHGVTIASGSHCCGAVNALDGMRMLATHAPTLPMSNCTMPAACRCRFRKFADRREDEQGRRFRFGQQERGAWYAGTQRRKSQGRRDQD
jgi:hypothetical protein